MASAEDKGNKQLSKVQDGLGKKDTAMLFHSLRKTLMKP